MPRWGLQKTHAPRLAPELDDEDLGRVLRRLEAQTRGPRQLDLEIALIEQLLHGKADSPDRRVHRASVLAAHAPGTIQRWRQHHPRDPDALALAALSRLAGTQSLSPGEPLNTPAQTSALHDALEDCQAAARLRPDDCVPWVAALAITRALRLPWVQMHTTWREVCARDPWNRRSHLEMLGYLSPEECGSLTAMRDFVTAVQNDAPEVSPVAGLALSAEVWRYTRAQDANGRGTMLAEHFWLRPASASLLDTCVARWLQPDGLIYAEAIADLNTLAFALAHAARPADAFAVFPRIRGLVTPWPWNVDGNPVERFAHWHAVTRVRS
jgi:hypothetical protein